MGFPSNWNSCFRAHLIEAASLEHQRAYCLSANHQHCPLFGRKGKFSMPAELRLHGNGVKDGKQTIQKVAVGLCIALVVLLIGWQVSTRIFHVPFPIIPFGNEPALPSATLSSSSSAAPVNTSLLEMTVTILPTRTPTPSFTPSASFTPRRSLSLDVPLGLDNQFLIHKVAEGDSLELLANRYSTTVEAIRAVNYQMHSPVWVGEVIVIPLYPNGLLDYPPFEPYMVGEENITVQDLAQELSVDASSLAFYNALDEKYDLMPGDWVLVPREKAAP